MLVFGGNAEAAKCTSSLFSAHGALLQWSQLTANVNRENTQIQRKCAQTLFSASHNFPSTQMQQKRAARDQIHNNSVSCDRQFLETVQLSIKRNLHNPQSRVRQFYDSARRKTWKSVLIYSVTVLYSVIQC